MTQGEQVSVIDHVDRVSDGLLREIRAVHHRIDESQAASSREHADVRADLAGIAKGQEALTGRVDTVEATVDQARGAWSLGRMMLVFLGGFLAALAAIAAVIVAVVQLA